MRSQGRNNYTLLWGYLSLYDAWHAMCISVPMRCIVVLKTLLRHYVYVKVLVGALNPSRGLLLLWIICFKLSYTGVKLMLQLRPWSGV